MSNRFSVSRCCCCSCSNHLDHIWDGGEIKALSESPPSGISFPSPAPPTVSTWNYSAYSPVPVTSGSTVEQNSTTIFTCPTDFTNPNFRAVMIEDGFYVKYDSSAVKYIVFFDENYSLYADLLSENGVTYCGYSQVWSLSDTVAWDISVDSFSWIGWVYTPSSGSALIYRMQVVAPTASGLTIGSGYAPVSGWPTAASGGIGSGFSTPSQPQLIVSIAGLPSSSLTITCLCNFTYQNLATSKTHIWSATSTTQPATRSGDSWSAVFPFRYRYIDGASVADTTYNVTISGTVKRS